MQDIIPLTRHVSSVTSTYCRNADMLLATLRCGKLRSAFRLLAPGPDGRTGPGKSGAMRDEN